MRVIVTGAASGIGRAIAERLLADGHQVIALDLRPVDLPGADCHALDQGDPSSIDRALAAITGPVDGLVNSAGLPPRPGNEVQLLRVNLIGLKHLTGAVLDRLTPGGAVVTIASRAGHAWRENLTQARAALALGWDDDVAGFCAREGIDALRAYALSKEALILWTRQSTAPLIARNLRMNTLCPAAVETPLLEDFARLQSAESIVRNAARTARMGRVADIAPVASFLLSPESGWIKGEALALDGGLSAIAEAEALGL